MWEILRNPKYTGHQVWNCRQRKKGNGRHNPPEGWIWSDAPCHPPIISRQEYEQVQAKAAQNSRSRRDDTTGRPVRKKTEYLFRGRLVCACCGLRVWGSRPAHPYYRCLVSHQRGANIPPEHPRTVNLGEGLLIEATTTFLARAVYGPDRLAYWTRVLGAADQPDPAAPTRARIAEVERAMADTQRRLRNQVLALEDDGVTVAARRRISDRIGELEAEIAGQQASLAKLRAQIEATPPDAPTVAELLEGLPLFGERLREFSQPDLRRLFDSLDLMISYDPIRHAARVRITLATDVGPLRGTGRCPRQGTSQTCEPPCV